MTDIAVASMFETPLLIDTLPHGEDINLALATAIRQRREQNPAGLARSNRHGWHSDLAIGQWGGPAFQALAARVLALANAHSTDIRPPEAPRYRWLSEGWANILESGASHQFHYHPGAFWSAVYYVDDGYGGSDDAALGGEFEIEDPRLPMVVMEEPYLRFRPRRDWPVPQHELTIRPATGMLMMIPGWLRHGVRPYQGTGQRISMVINLTAARMDE